MSVGRLLSQSRRLVSVLGAKVESTEDGFLHCVNVLAHSFVMYWSDLGC